MRALLSAVFLGVLATGAYADVIDDVRSCKAETDSLKRLTCFDAIAIAPSEQAGTATPSPTNKPSTAAPVELVSAAMRVRNKDYQRQIFHDRVELVPTFKNTSKKTVVAIAHTLSVTDAFGDKVIDGTSKLDIKIPPGKTVQSDTFYMWEDNQFLQGEPYDKLTGPVSTGTAKATLNVTKVIYSDGTSESF